MKSDDVVTAIKRMVKHYGREFNYRMTIGEMGELLSLFGKQAQGRATHEEWIDEVADVTIMMLCMTEIIGPDQVRKRINFKLKRQMNRMDCDELDSTDTAGDTDSDRPRTSVEQTLSDEDERDS